MIIANFQPSCPTCKSNILKIHFGTKGFSTSSAQYECGCELTEFSEGIHPTRYCPYDLTNVEYFKIDFSASINLKLLKGTITPDFVLQNLIIKSELNENLYDSHRNKIIMHTGSVNNVNFINSEKI